ncbi:MAG TPA: PD-(D/E)XK nuclease family protein, partial [Planctomycetota bacterium]|nr:PD-(D/E)XK nuclease family protein [Planctomycetota bacterium]
TSSATLPQKREPAVASFLTLIRVLARGLERRAVMDLLRDRRIRAGASPALPADVDSWDRWSRALRTGSGIDEWRELGEALPDMRVLPAGEAPDPEARRRDAPRPESVARLLVLLEELEMARLRWGEAATFEEHAAFLKDLQRRWLTAGHEGEDAAREDAPGAVADLIEEVGLAHLAHQAARGARAGPEAPIAPGVVEDFLQRAAAASPRPIHGEDEGGLRVLDLMQARGLVHRAVIWIGFQGELFPRKAGLDPFLGETDRARLAAAGFLVRPRLEASSEERILLAMTLAGATERLVISFERADSDGRKRGRSSALREVARAFLGRPDASALLDAAPGNPWTPESVPAHPSYQALHLAGSPRWGLLPRAAAVAGAAAGARDGVGTARSMLSALGCLEPERIAALDHVEAVDRCSGGAGPQDGFTGLGLDPARRFSPTSIERLLTCPQQFFLRDVLRVHEIEEEVVPHRLTPLVLGRAAHNALCAAYADLGVRGFFTRPDAGPEEALDLVDLHWRREVARAAGPSTRRLRALFAMLSEIWRQALRRFVELDIAELRAAGSIIQSTEGRFEADVDFAPDITLPLAGYVDRLIESRGRLSVEDYKTGARLEEKAKPTRILQGRNVQLPLYREIVARHLGRDPLSIEAAFLAVRPDMEEARVRVPIDSEPEVLSGFRESVAVAWRLAMAGLFPLHRDNDGTGRNAGYCGHCSYRRTCRRTHPPTAERLRKDDRLADMRDVRKKKWGTLSQRLPTLSAVRERAAGEEVGEAEGDDE